MLCRFPAICRYDLSSVASYPSIPAPHTATTLVRTLQQQVAAGIVEAAQAERKAKLNKEERRFFGSPPRLSCPSLVPVVCALATVHTVGYLTPVPAGAPVAKACLLMVYTHRCSAWCVCCVLFGGCGW